MDTWTGHLCSGVRGAVALLAAALGAGSVALAGDALPLLGGAAQAPRAAAAKASSSRATKPAFVAASTKLASKPLRASA